MQTVKSMVLVIYWAIRKTHVQGMIGRTMMLFGVMILIGSCYQDNPIRGLMITFGIGAIWIGARVVNNQ